MLDAVMSPADRQWFAGSKVVDARGRPLPVWHGSPHVFDEFDFSRVGLEMGMHFGTRATAQKFVTAAGELRSFWLRLLNPLVLRDQDPWGWNDELPLQLEELGIITKAQRDAHNDIRVRAGSDAAGAALNRALLLRLGYDGVRYKNRFEGRGTWSWIALLPQQIRPVFPRMR